MSKNLRINGVIYSNVPSITVPLSDTNGNAEFFDTTDDTAAAEHILQGRTAHSSDGEVVGTMVNKGSTDIAITTLQPIEIGEGYYDGTGVAYIDDSLASDIKSENIRSGVSLFGVSGDVNVVNTSDGTVSSEELLNGEVAYSGGQRIVGSLVVPRISQDETTYVLTIS